MEVLNQSVLVLNKYLLAVQVTTVRDAISNLVAERVEVIDRTYAQYSLSNWVKQYAVIQTTGQAHLYCGEIRSPSIIMYAPQVIVATELLNFKPLLQTIRYSRQNVFERDNFTCQYCGQKIARKQCTLDHVVPRSAGGTNTWTNVVTACIQCNTLKSNRTIEQLGWQLIRVPTVPTWKSHINKSFNENKNIYWENFLHD